MRPHPSIVAIVLLAAAAHAEPRRPAHTYSIVARDAKTGQIGVAVQSHWFSVGQLVTWAEPGVGAVATQSFVEPSYGKLGLALMAAGKSAPDALRALLAADEGRDVRQVGMIDAAGRVASHTGLKCIPAAGHQLGKGYAVQANLMTNETIWPAMAKAFETTKGDLAERMMATLEAGDRAGGDIRGRQSAAIVIVAGKPTGQYWTDRPFDLRVDDSPKPLEELRRLIHAQRAYNLMNEGDAAMARKDVAGARKAYGAAAKMLPEQLELVYWAAIALVQANRVGEALPLFARVFAAEPRWAELTQRLPKVGLLPDDPALLKKILAQKK